MDNYDPFADGKFKPVRLDAENSPPPAYDPFADGKFTPVPFKDAIAQSPAAEPDAVRQKLAAGGVPSFDEAKLLYDDEDKKPWLPQLGDVWEGLKGVGSTLAEGAKEAPQMLAHPVRGVATVAEAGGRGTYQMADLVRRAYNKARDFVSEQTTGATRDQKIEHFRQRLIANQAYDQVRQGNMLPQAVTDVVPPFEKAAEAGSVFLDPIAVGTGLTAGLPEAVLRAGARQLLAKAPALAKAADVAASAINLPGRVLSKVPAAVETTGRAVKSLAELPEKAIKGAIDTFIPESVQSAAEQALHLGGASAIGATALGHGGPITHVMAALAAGQKIGLGMEQAGGFARRLVELSGPGQIPALLALAKDTTAPGWMRGLAGTLDSLGVGTAAETAGAAAKGAAHGAVFGTGIGAATSETQEERGHAIGTGIGLGATGGVTGHLASVKQRLIADRMGDLADFYLHLKEQGTPDHVIKKIQDSEALIASRFAGHPAMQAATAKAVFGDKLNFRFLEKDDYAKATAGDPNTAAFFDGTSIVVNVDASRNALTHELAHAISKGVGADGESRLMIDSVFSPQELSNIGREYASRLVEGDLKDFPATGKPVPDRASPEYAQLVDQKTVSLNERFKGDRWLYDEIYAEAGFGGMLDKDLNRQVINRPLWDRLQQSVRERFFTDAGLSPELPRGALFSNAKVYGPEMQKMVRDHLQQIYREGAKGVASKEGKEGVPTGTPVPVEMYGKHPAAPVGSDNIIIANGAARPATTAEINRRVRDRQAAVKAIVAAQPEQPKNSLKPEVAPRVTSEGQKEVSGTRFADQLAKLPQFSDDTKRAAKLLEGAFGSGNVFELWYQAIGRASNWAGDVRRRLGNLAVSQIRFAPFKWKVSNEGNVLVEGLSLAAAQRKLSAWADNEKSFLHTFWGGDQKAFMGDLLTYLRNHAEGRAGSEGLDDKRRDALNVFVIGKNVTYADLNPFRAALRGDEKKGIIRSLRLDRIANPQAVDGGWFAEYGKKVKNLSPQFSPDLEALRAERDEWRNDWINFRAQAQQRYSGAWPARAQAAEQAKRELAEEAQKAYRKALRKIGPEVEKAEAELEEFRANAAQHFGGYPANWPVNFRNRLFALSQAANRLRVEKPKTQEQGSFGLAQQGSLEGHLSDLTSRPDSDKQQNSNAVDLATGLPTFYKTGISAERAREAVVHKSAAQKARNLVLAVLKQASDSGGATFDKESADRSLAKNSHQSRFIPAINLARRFLLYPDFYFEQIAAGGSQSPEVIAAARAAREALPHLNEASPFAEFLNSGGSAHRDRFKLLGEASEGPVILDQQTDFVYKLQLPSFFLSDIEPKTEGASKEHLLTASRPASFFDILNKIDRQSRIQGGLPVEIQGLGPNDTLILKMPRLERDATKGEVRKWLKQHGADSDVKSERHPDSLIQYEPVHRDQPILRDQWGNSYAASDIREGEELANPSNPFDRTLRKNGKYPNFMADANGRVFMTDVMLRPIDASDVGVHPELAPYSPRHPEKILYSPERDMPKRKGKFGEFWLAPDGKIILAPEGHYNKGLDFLPKNWKPENPQDPMASLYPDVDAKGYRRGLAEEDAITVEGGSLNRAQRQALEDLAFERRLPVLHNGRSLDIGPDQKRQLSPDREQPEMFGSEQTNGDATQATFRGAARRAAQLRKAYPEAVPAIVNRSNNQIQKIPYDLANAPGVKRSGEKQAVAVTAARMAREVRASMNRPEIAEAKGWYDRTQEKLQALFGANADMLGQLLAATSARTGVRDNFKTAIEALRLYSSGFYDDLLARFASFVDKGGKLRDWQEFPLKANGQKFSANSKQVLKVLATVWAEGAGRKTKQFYQNLTGADDNATIDVWAARALRRLLYQSETPRWRLLPAQEKAVSDRDFSFAQKVFAEAGKKLNLTPEDAQSLMWFIEKDLWDKKGWTRGTGAEKSSFESEINKLLGLPGQGEFRQIVKESVPSPYRVQAGVTIHTTPESFRPERFETVRKALLNRLRKTKGLLALRVNSAHGLYGETREPSYDVEGTFRHPQALQELEKTIYDLGQAGQQSDVFVSAVVDKHHPNARPGLELRFRRPLTLEQARPILDQFEAAGVYGFSTATDNRSRLIGMRTQYVPELAGLFDEKHLDPKQIQANQAEWIASVERAMESLDRRLISSDNIYFYDTRVFHKGEPFTPRGSHDLETELERRRAALKK